MIAHWPRWSCIAVWREVQRGNGKSYCGFHLQQVKGVLAVVGVVGRRWKRAPFLPLAVAVLSAPHYGSVKSFELIIVVRNLVILWQTRYFHLSTLESEQCNSMSRVTGIWCRQTRFDSNKLTNQMQQFYKFITWRFVSLNMFRAPSRPSSGAYNCINSLWFYLGAWW